LAVSARDAKRDALRLSVRVALRARPQALRFSPAPLRSENTKAAVQRVLEV